MDERPTHVDLFSGIGGFALAAREAGFRTVAFCEIEPYCQKVLAKNFGAILPDDSLNGRGSRRERRPNSSGQGERKQALQNVADTEHSGREGRGQHEVSDGRQTDAASSRCEIWPDIFTFDGTRYRGVVLLTGGFPCQPFSVAGKRRGAADDRHLWPQMLRVIGEARPAWVLGENVPGLIPMELDNVLSQLEGISYATRAFVIPACAVDARHRRDRLWIVGRDVMADAAGNNGRNDREQGASPSGLGRGRERIRSRSLQARTFGGASKRENPQPCSWLPEPTICELANGLPDGLVRYAGRIATKVPNRVHKLRALGNSIVPQCAYEILRVIYDEIQNATHHS